MLPEAAYPCTDLGEKVLYFVLAEAMAGEMLSLEKDFPNPSYVARVTPISPVQLQEKTVDQTLF